MTKEVFNDRPPIYHGETIDGFCGLCNIRQPVTLRFWFACGICWNVVLGYQKGFVAAKAVHEYWLINITPHFPRFHLLEKEEIFLSPFVRAAKTKRAAAEVLDILDFLVVEGEDAGADPVFHIELKSGPGAITDMKEFQLDVNDSNDIIGACRYTKLPAYIFHVQLEHEYFPPTRGTRAVGMWWTDLMALLEHRKSVKQRRGEDKDAGYYDPKAFQSIDTFPRELETREYEQLRKKLLANPPAMT